MLNQLLFCTPKILWEGIPSGFKQAKSNPNHLKELQAWIKPSPSLQAIMVVKNGYPNRVPFLHLFTIVASITSTTKYGSSQSVGSSRICTTLLSLIGQNLWWLLRGIKGSRFSKTQQDECLVSWLMMWHLGREKSAIKVRVEACTRGKWERT